MNKTVAIDIAPAGADELIRRIDDTKRPFYFVLASQGRQLNALELQLDSDTKVPTLRIYLHRDGTWNAMMDVDIGSNDEDQP